MSKNERESGPDVLCDWKRKDFVQRFDALREIVTAPRYACTKCGRAAAEKARLCKPKKL